MAEKLSAVIDFAIENEIKAAELYEKYADIVELKTSSDLLSDMAKMERGHEAKLKEFKATGSSQMTEADTVPDLQISDYLVDTELTESSTLQDVFVYAIKAEEKAYQLYTKLCSAEGACEPGDLFSVLATEEKHHKLNLELEYEKLFMKEN